MRVTFWCSAPVVTFPYTQCPAEGLGLIQGVGEHSMMRDDVWAASHWKEDPNPSPTCSSTLQLLTTPFTFNFMSEHTTANMRNRVEEAIIIGDDGIVYLANWRWNNWKTTTTDEGVDLLNIVYMHTIHIAQTGLKSRLAKHIWNVEVAVLHHVQDLCGEKSIVFSWWSNRGITSQADFGA